MHIWYLEDWKKDIDLTMGNHRCGLRLKFDADIDPSVRIYFKKFTKWLRREFFFPIRVSVYVKSDYRIRARDGERVVGTFFRPDNYGVEPYIRLATGDYQELKEKRGEEQAMWAILQSFAHELTHYFQYINRISLTSIGEERQATMYSNYILEDYDEYLKNGENTKPKNIWQGYAWKKNVDLTRRNHKTGLRLIFDRSIEPKVRKACKKFVSYLKTEYFFPIRVVIHISKVTKIMTAEGDKKDAIFKCSEDNYTAEPCIHIATGRYVELCTKRGENTALMAILFLIAYELTYYFQWVNNVKLTSIGAKRQAGRYARNIVNEYEEKFSEIK